MGRQVPVALVLDPGLTTGAFLNYGDLKGPVIHAEWKGEWEALKHIEQWCRDADEPGSIVVEQFDIVPSTANRARKDIDPPLSVYWAARWLAHKHDVPFIGQSRQVRKRVTDDHLKSLGWYSVGMGHANDAARHYVAWLLRKGIEIDGIS